MTTDLILGTAGHIDHGKTSLVKLLTGVDTDRLPEEKQRGITIDLGFAELALGDFRLGIVDVPGHERFVRNMLAGATGVDLALLVIAADDSIKPQTLEHLEILKLLDLRGGVIALTKCDLAEPNWIDLVEEEIRDLVAGTFLADAPIIRTSTVQGAGIHELKQALESVAAQVAPHVAARRRGPFRMAIDRSFTVAGHGAVVTGSVGGGKVEVGDELALEPGGRRVRVRGLNVHARAVDEAHRGQRAAINLAGIHHNEVRRGLELATIGHLVPSRRMTVQLHATEQLVRPLKNRARVRLHLGAAEIMATVLLLNQDRLESGQQGLAQLYLAEPAVATWGQPFVIRSESPVITIGGGHVLDPTAERLRRGEVDGARHLAEWRAEDPLARAATAVRFFALREWQPVDLVRTAGVEDYDSAVRELARRGDILELAVPPNRRLRVHKLALEDIFARIETSLKKLHARFPLQTTVEKSRLTGRYLYLGGESVVEAVLKAMQAAGRIRLSERGVAIAGHGPKLTTNERKLLEEIIARYREAEFQPPSVAEVKAETTKNQASVAQLIALAASDGDLVKLTNEYYLHADNLEKLKALLREQFRQHASLTVSQIRELIGTSRKYAVPLCEYLDRTGFTRRDGDHRFLNDTSA
jgi:selenocysteine-specific elongation factor